MQDLARGPSVERIDKLGAGRKRLQKRKRLRVQLRARVVPEAGRDAPPMRDHRAGCSGQLAARPEQLNRLLVSASLRSS